MGWISGLESLKKKSTVAIFSDSQYVGNGISRGWAKKWRKNNWMRNKTDPAKNADLWERLLKLTEHHNVTFYWVKGHVGIDENERCDELAVNAAQGNGLMVDTAYEQRKMLPGEN